MNSLFVPKTVRGPHYKEDLGLYNFEEPLPIEVRMHEWRTSQDRLWTESAVTCVAMAAFNADTGVNLLGHFSWISTPPIEFHGDRDIFDRALLEIPRLGPPRSTHIRLAGATLYFAQKDSDTGTPADRLYAETGVSKMAEQVGIPPGLIVVGWNEGDQVVGMSVDCAEHDDPIDVYLESP